MIDPRNPDYASTPAHPSRAPFHYAPAQPADHATPSPVTATPAVTIMTPYYNTGPIFHETATSVFRQSFQNWEWLIVNDGSTDPVARAVLDEYRDRDPRVRVIDLPENRGLSAARNAGYAAARADLVMQIDSDDLAEPTFLEKCVWFLATNPQWGFVCGWTVGFGHDTYLWGRGFHNLDRFLHENLVTPTALVRKSVWQAAGGYDEHNRKGLEDWDFWLRCASSGHWGTCIPEFLDWYRRRPNHNSSWGNWDRGPNQERFSQELRTKYAGLYERGLPRPKTPWPIAMAPLPARPPVANPLAKTKPRLLMLVPWLRFGGADKFNLDLIQQATARGYEVTVAATLEGDQSWHPHYTRLTPDVFVLEKFLRPADRVLFIRALIESRRPDVVMITNSELGYHLLPYLRAHCPRPAYVDLCHIEEENWKSGGYPRYATAMQDQLDLNIVVSEHLKSWMVSRGADASRVEVAHINVDPAVWVPDDAERARVRAELNIPANATVLLYPARLTAQKQPKILAETLRRLHARPARPVAALGDGERAGVRGEQPGGPSTSSSPPVITLIAGDGEDRPWLEAFLREHALEPHVRLLGAQPPEKMPGLFRAADILFLPSKWEGIALSIFEAMAAGLCVVGADVGGQRELVTPGTGILLDLASHPVDEQADTYARTLTTLIADAPARHAMGRAARERILAAFTLDAMGERLLSLFAHAARLRDTQPRTPLPPRLADELAVRAIDYFRLQKACERSAKSTPTPAAQPHKGTRPTSKPTAAPAPARRPRRKARRAAKHAQAAPPRPSPDASALVELKGIEASRAWRAVESIRSSWPYALYARARFGPQWRQARASTSALPPAQRLTNLKNSGAYRLIASVKSTALYRTLRPRRA